MEKKTRDMTLIALIALVGVLLFQTSYKIGSDYARRECRQTQCSMEEK